MKQTSFILIVSFLVFSGCGSLNLTILTPADTQTLSNSKHDGATWSCFPGMCFHSYGTGCDPGPLSAESVGAGYHYNYENGTPPCNCWYYVDCVFRGAVRFDLGVLRGKEIVRATLMWENRGACVTRLYAARLPWNRWAHLIYHWQISDPWPPDSSGRGELRVDDIVRNWVQGIWPNYGFLFVGPDESYANWEWDHGDYEIGTGLEGDHDCLSSVGPFVLVVTYRE